MEYDARYIANFILMKFDATSYLISNKKINKLIYICHGHFLAELHRSIIRNHVEAWEHGPVYRVVYDSFKKFEFRPIKDLAEYYDFRKGHQVIADPSCLSIGDQEFLYATCSKYIDFSANELEKLTHDPSGPWAEVFLGNRKSWSNRICTTEIGRYFSNRINSPRN